MKSLSFVSVPFPFLFLSVFPFALIAQEKSVGAMVSNSIGSFVQRGNLNPVSKKDYESWVRKYNQLTTEEKVHYCIYQLRNEHWFQSDWAWDNEPHTKEPEKTAMRELVKLGRHAMPHLIEALNSKVKTGIIYHRILPEPWLVQDAVLDVIESIACRSFEPNVLTVSKLTGAKKENAEKIRDNVRNWWKENQLKNEIEWAKEVLLGGKPIPNGNRYIAITSLHDRLGKKSHPFLAKAYHRLPKGRDDDNSMFGLKAYILQKLLKYPGKEEKPVFEKALSDAPIGVRHDGARGLWSLGDKSGLKRMIEETEGKLLKGLGSSDLSMEYDNLISFFQICNTKESRETIYKCLHGRNPYLRAKAIYAVQELRMEKGIRALPGLFDDPFVLGGSYTSHQGETQTIVPPRQMCDEAAETFTKLVPAAPRFGGKTDKEQELSIEKIQDWWEANKQKLVWNSKQGKLLLKK